MSGEAPVPDPVEIKGASSPIVEKTPAQDTKPNIQAPQASAEQEAKRVTEQRRSQADQFKKEGKTLKETVDAFDNDYSPLEKAYQSRVGAPLIGDSFEDSEHPIPISKSCSVVIPAYNAGAQLERTLKAIEASSFNAQYPKQLEVVVVDDGSPQVNIAEEVRDMGIKDLTVKVYRESNGRENKARYSGVLAATGDIVIFTAQDTVYSPTMIESYMKRHEVLDDTVFFSFRQEIETQDARLNPDQIEGGSLSTLPINIDEDPRVKRENMRDSKWLKVSSDDEVVPIDVEDDRYYGWTVPKLAYGFSVSAPREALLKTKASHDERYKGFGGDDEHLVDDLIAEGFFVIPNTGGIAYHQSHSSRWDENEAAVNRAVLEEYKNSPVKRQDPNDPQRTDAQLQLEIQNGRTEPKDFLKPQYNLQDRATMLLKMGLYEQALPLFLQAEAQFGQDVWFIHDEGLTYLGLGGKDNVVKAIGYLEQAVKGNPDNAAARASLAQAYGRAGRYEECKAMYREALKLDPENEDAQIIDPGQQEPMAHVDRLHELGQLNMQRGKPASALKYYEAAVALVGEDKAPWSIFDKGVIHAQLGQFDMALESLQKAQQLMPTDTWVSSRLGMVYEQIGDKDAATTHYKNALAQDPGNSQAREGIDRLQGYAF